MIISFWRAQVTNEKKAMKEEDGGRADCFAPIISKTHRTQACTLISMHKRSPHIYFSGEVFLI